MKPTQTQPSTPEKKDSTQLFFNIFMALLALGFVYMIVLLFSV